MKPGNRPVIVPPMVPGAVRPSIAPLATTQARNSSHQPKAGGTVIDRRRASAMVIGTRRMIRMNEVRPNSHQSGNPSSSTVIGQPGPKTRRCSTVSVTVVADMG